jgi:hypothetical protein
LEEAPQKEVGSRKDEKKCEKDVVERVDHRIKTKSQMSKSLPAPACGRQGRQANFKSMSKSKFENQKGYFEFWH